MKLLAISDTHGEHTSLGTLPETDVLIHAGDACVTGSIEEFMYFKKWFKQQPSQYKIFVAGNHDICLEQFPFIKEELTDDGIIYLENTPITLEGIHFYGSPYTPEFCNWAFSYQREKAYWEHIPNKTNVLITHGPPYGILDQNPKGLHCGCESLEDRLKRLVHLKAHVFGHIHSCAGRMLKYYNVSCYDSIHYGLGMRPPTEITIYEGNTRIPDNQ